MTKNKLSIYAITLALFASYFVTSRAQAETEVPLAPETLGITVGLNQPPTLNYGTELVSVNRLVGKTQGIVLYYTDWSTTYNSFLQDQFDKQMPAAQKPISMIAWIPVRGKKALGCDQDYANAIPLDSITNGACDTYIRNNARAMKAKGERFLLKFAYEMNLSIWAWSPVNQGQPISKFIAMWQHVHTIFQQEGAANVEFVWDPVYQSDPNVPSNDVTQYYPGDAYVDWVSLHGFNYVDQLNGVPYYQASFEFMFDARLKQFACLYRKPQMIGETGSVEDSRRQVPKTQWITDAYQKASNYPFLRAMIYYNDRDSVNPNADFRITSSTANDGNVSSLPTGSGAWTTAYKNAIAPATFTHILPTLAEATPPTTYCGTGTPAPALTVSPASVTLKPGEGTTLDVTSLFFNDSPVIAIDAPAGMTVTPSPRSVPSPWGTMKLTLRTTTALANGIYTVKLTAGNTTQSFIVTVGELKKTLLPLIIQ